MKILEMLPHLTPEEREVLDLIDRYNDAMTAGDLDLYFSYCDEDFTIFIPMIGRSWLNHCRLEGSSSLRNCNPLSNYTQVLPLFPTMSAH
jgi:hypothetical protein